MDTSLIDHMSGARGIGDRYYPTYGNGGFEVATYDIRVTYEPETLELSGTTMIAATAAHDLSEFSLDFGLDATEVRVDGQPAGFARDEMKLLVIPAEPIAAGSDFVVTVLYSGVPEAVELAGRNPWTTTPTGAVVIGMPEVSTTWFPSNDHPRNKAIYRITITVPEGLAAISNGNLVSKSTVGGYTTWSWYEPHPMATYLTLIAIGRFEVESGVTASGLPYTFAIAEGDDPEYALARKDIERTAEVVDWMAERFGPYPFDSIGAVVPDGDIVYAPEPQTRPVYGKLMWSSGKSNMLTVVHENAHQWFGNSVSVDQWRDIWLSESFARYAEWLWSEDHAGKTAQQMFDDLYAEHPVDDRWWTFLVGEPGAGRIFEDPLYGRGAMALQALRNLVGEQTFRRTLREWTAARRFGNATIEDFVQHASTMTGTDLCDFFDTWLFTPTKPPATAGNGFPSGTVQTDQ